MRLPLLGLVGLVGCAGSDPVEPVVAAEPQGCAAVPIDLVRDAGLEGEEVIPSDPADEGGFEVEQGGRSDFVEPRFTVHSPSRYIGMDADLQVDGESVAVTGDTVWVELADWTPECAGWAQVRLFPPFAMWQDCSLHQAPATLRITVTPIGEASPEPIGAPVELSIEAPIVISDEIRERLDCR